MVVHGAGGLDEFSLMGTTKVSEIKDGWIKTYEIDPREYGFEYCKIEDILGGTPQENSQITLDILNGEKGPKRDIVVLNSATAIYSCGEAKTFAEAIKIAEKSIDSGNALKKLNELREISPVEK